tara:strand:- start:2061 stop:2381 length:321 start_codon:yes stop_codon:yes gene_type:complete
MKHLKSKITALLKQKPDTKENDLRLTAWIWYEQIQKLENKQIEDVSFMDFIRLFVNKKLAHPESVRRCRAKLQELTPELRGKNYINRIKHTKNWIKELKGLENEAN